MEALQKGEIRVHLKGGHNYVCPEANKNRVIQSLGKEVARIEHYKPAVAAPVAKPTPPKPVVKAVPVKSKASLLGKLLVDNKVTAVALIKWINESKSIEDIGIVLTDESRKTVKDAAKLRLSELL